MKIKSFVLMGLLFGAFIMGSAQEFEKGSKVLNLGVGLGGYGTWGYHMVVPPVSASFEVGILDGILDKGSVGVGGYVGLASYKDDYNSSYGYWTFNRMFLGARGVFHYPFIDKLDTYGGLMVGFNSYMWKWHGESSSPIEPGNSGLGSSIFFGGRYYFNDKFAGMAELGYGISYLNLGIALRL